MRDEREENESEGVWHEWISSDVGQSSAQPFFLPSLLYTPPMPNLRFPLLDRPRRLIAISTRRNQVLWILDLLPTKELMQEASLEACLTHDSSLSSFSIDNKPIPAKTGERDNAPTPNPQALHLTAF